MSATQSAAVRLGLFVGLMAAAAGCESSYRRGEPPATRPAASAQTPMDVMLGSDAERAKQATLANQPAEAHPPAAPPAPRPVNQPRVGRP